ncbi:hypothetical protein halTADL_2722 [Halohasta litchfieldiae]|jgi:Zn finger protein HypA/HybF involved in hydrogenase expression|uniref:DUF8106 domain-containing protein n=1 Tax=Halohasta litchfieldiae TaxID=1073996 RepID=A0A1H6UVL6_9EURY|nr:hypothetical protein [Halohasta litchfieldiae]ATW89438.1 hypothetical protein halTADL_2722 [Halohasta litchfieldiae]SEI92380.1 hypothetical protein SAMN05444271_11218 [Halohasta litchfieldiae]
MSPSTLRSQQRSQKAMLYCPNCNYASRINGDWVLHLNATSVDYECPNCETTIDSRRDGSTLTARSGGGLQFRSAD